MSGTKPFFFRAGDGPILVEVPHAGLGIPERFATSIAAQPREILQDADTYVDTLTMEMPRSVSVLCATISRLVVDLNRDALDIAGDCVKGAPTHSAPTHKDVRKKRGVIWNVTTRGRPFPHAPISRAEYRARINTIYEPYHCMLANAINRARDKYGFAILLALHSMPSRGLTNTQNHKVVTRPDVILGTRFGQSCSANITKVVENTFSRHAWSTVHDRPYAGGYTTGYYGRPKQNYHALQIEISRAKYMDEHTLKPHALHEVSSIIVEATRCLEAQCLETALAKR